MCKEDLGPESMNWIEGIIELKGFKGVKSR
jgi:hypothetical protein